MLIRIVYIVEQVPHYRRQTIYRLTESNKSLPKTETVTNRLKEQLCNAHERHPCSNDFEPGLEQTLSSHNSKNYKRAF